MIDKLDVTHTGTLGIQALLAGILRGDGNVKANFDNAQVPSTSPPFIRAGAGGLIDFYLGASTPFTVPCLITKVNYQSTVEGKVEYDFDVSLNSLAGNYVYPVA